MSTTQRIVERAYGRYIRVLYARKICDRTNISDLFEGDVLGHHIGFKKGKPLEGKIWNMLEN